jgi:flagellar motor switch/type III secretory pathway protein FliN
MEESRKGQSQEGIGTAVPREEQASDPLGAWALVDLLPCTLGAELPIPGMTVGDIVDLEAGTVINSRHPRNYPVPVWVNGVRIGSAELEIVDKTLAVRITEID